MDGFSPSGYRKFTFTDNNNSHKNWETLMALITNRKVSSIKCHFPYPQNAGYHISLTNKPQRKFDVASISFDLYKNNPQDFIGCLNVKATLYGTYSVSYNLQCYSAKRMMK